ncbi:hypothetical protein L8C07_03675 [Paenibacillus sp. CMAA1739]|uniref:hypothetical protein n=1 Tax=Paenibacillus ottowii TaxID=2315729 RepID=UPI002DB7A8D0|nr:hypothetical protein [Paenibacillus sp. CMAA1739]MEC4565029.1 hypothetical protein [Paenibacillus sp. CMAA1739]
MRKHTLEAKECEDCRANQSSNIGCGNISLVYLKILQPNRLLEWWPLLIYEVRGPRRADEWSVENVYKADGLLH